MSVYFPLTLLNLYFCKRVQGRVIDIIANKTATDFFANPFLLKPLCQHFAPLGSGDAIHVLQPKRAPISKLFAKKIFSTFSSTCTNIAC